MQLHDLEVVAMRCTLERSFGGNMMAKIKPEEGQKPVVEVVSKWIKIAIYKMDWRIILGATTVALFYVYMTTR